MSSIITLILGAVGGFLLHAISMKISFKNRTIDNKINVFDNIIASWVSMRNFIYSDSRLNHQKLDQMYGESQRSIGACILVCEDQELTENINSLNEKLYRTNWTDLPTETMNKEIEEIKIEAWEIINRMREDVKESTRLNRSDFLHIIKGFLR
ncbi:MAG: hypothetical protein ACRENO_05595 [Thermodesulfobacteriota bacterium]